MLFGTKKLYKETAVLSEILEPGDSLTEEELQNIKQQVFQAIKAGSPAVSPRYFWKLRIQKVFRYTISFLLGVSLVGGTAFASNTSKPGDFLYPVKRVKEKVELSVAASEEARADLEIKFAQNRLEELHELATKEDSGVTYQTDQSSADLVSPSTAPVSLITSTSIESASGTPKQPENSRQKNSKRKQLEIRAEADAQAQVNNALGGLGRLYNRLKAKGDAKAAAGVQASIFKLKNRARAEHLNVEDDSNDHPNKLEPGQAGIPKADDNPKPTTTNESQGQRGWESKERVKIQLTPGDSQPLEAPSSLRINGNLDNNLEIKD